MRVIHHHHLFSSTKTSACYAPSSLILKHKGKNISDCLKFIEASTCGTRSNSNLQWFCEFIGHEPSKSRVASRDQYSGGSLLYTLSAWLVSFVHTANIYYLLASCYLFILQAYILCLPRVICSYSKHIFSACLVLFVHTASIYYLLASCYLFIFQTYIVCLPRVICSYCEHILSASLVLFVHTANIYSLLASCYLFILRTYILC